jgi:hypothetical protein
MRTVRFVVVLVSILCPAIASAQSSLAGAVKDSSGAVLPGVTVEASSPALIEKVRSVATDTAGQYKIVDLRPGTYTLTFSLTGFSVVKREGIELTGGGTVTVNADMKVGTLQETVTVTGETPVVDVQNAARQEILSGDLAANTPAAKSWNGLMLLMPGITGDPNTVQLTPSMVLFGIHGGPTTEGRLQLDEMNVGASRGGGGVSGYSIDTANVQEVTFRTSGGLGDAETGGPLMNFVPKTGGNTFKGSSAFQFANSSLQSSNYTSALQAAGLKVPSVLLDLYDVDWSLGGPIKKDKLWFYYVGRVYGNGTSVPGMFANANAGNPNSWSYSPDTTLQARNDTSTLSDGLRLTWQVNEPNKINLFWDEQHGCSGAQWIGTNGSGCRSNPSGWIEGGSATQAPETGVYSTPPNRIWQAKWTDVISSKMLFEFGYSAYNNRWGGPSAPGNPTTDLIQVQEQGGSIPGLCYRSGSPLCGGTFLDSTGWISANTWKANMSYVTGSHNIKFGYNGLFDYDNQDSNYSGNPQDLVYRFDNGVPNQFWELSGLFKSQWRTRYDAGFVQDQWTVNRLTLQGALRYEHAWSYYPQSWIGGSRFIPYTVIPETQGVNFNNFLPRVGLAYDLFGTGKTSLKMNWGKYVQPAQNAGIFTGAAPTSEIASSATRSWHDTNGNYIPDCNLSIPTANGECGALSSNLFGTVGLPVQYSSQLLNGLRPWDYQIGVAVQQQVTSRISVEAQYNKRWFDGFYVSRNLALANESTSWTAYNITAPVDPRLPGGGGYAVNGLYDENPALFGQTNYQVQPASNYGNQYQYWDGVDLTVSMRPSSGFTFQGGTSTGQTVQDICGVASQVPEALQPPQNLAIGVATPGFTAFTIGQAGFTPMQYCHLASGFLTQFRGLGAYQVPRVGVEISATFQSKPGQQLAANYVMPASLIAQSLGRAPAGGVANVTVNLIAPGSLYGDRVNELDLRLSKILKFGTTRARVSVDMYNALNSAAVLSYNQTYSPTSSAWLTPTSVLAARVIKIGASFEF